MSVKFLIRIWIWRLFVSFHLPISSKYTETAIGFDSSHARSSIFSFKYCWILLSICVTFYFISFYSVPTSSLNVHTTSLFWILFEPEEHIERGYIVVYTHSKTQALLHACSSTTHIFLELKFFYNIQVNNFRTLVLFIYDN